MRLIVAGTRTLSVTPRELDVLIRGLAVTENLKVTEVVSGGARGIDACGEEWAVYKRKNVRRFPARWEVHGKSAGPKRNREMARYADAALVLWDGESRGSRNMISTMRALGKPVYVVKLSREFATK